tara:strand:- start:2351 stop:4264 length:1914 start_codon:yes stop_codon:yes gene_type:complete
VSLKYQRIRQRDEQLPVLVKQLTRAFSSITLAIIFLLLIITYGIIGSVPLGMLVQTLLMGLAILLPITIAGIGAWRTGRSRWQVGLALLGVAGLIAAMDVYVVRQIIDAMPWFTRYHTTVIYRLRFFEMTELEFFSWWPMKLLLGLFILNMIWATIRRIEFKFVNIGVLSVHSGIVILTIGSMFYGNAKQEGDTLLWRDDQPLTGTVNTFYDAVTPAIYFTVGQAQLGIPLPQLPRYNDYDPLTAALDIKLHETPEFKERFGNQLQAVIPGFLAYAKLQTAWMNDPRAEPNPAWQVQLIAGEKGPAVSTNTLVANSSMDSVLQGGSWSVQYMLAMTQTQIDALKQSHKISQQPVSRFYLIQMDPAKAELQLLICLPGRDAIQVPLTADRFPVATFDSHTLWLQVIRYIPNARQTFIPVPVVRSERISKEEGTYLNALLPVDLSMTLPDGRAWHRRVWLTHMRYPEPGIADDQNRPITLDIPTIGKVDLCFSRQQIQLPFSIALGDFAMVPYPGSHMPRDFYSHLTLTHPDGKSQKGVTRLNHPMMHGRIKISQTGWDPGDTLNPQNDAKDQQGQYIHQQRYVILGIGNNVGIHIIFAGSCLIVIGIPWAFYVKPFLLRHRKHSIQRQLQQSPTAEES